jgi:uncharacterized protein (TIGR02646 family)
MRTIIRTPDPPTCLSQQPLNQDWEAFMQTDCHRLVGDSLRREQRWICCYCETEVGELDSHIEHFVPRNGPDGDSSLTYSYPNVAASCNGGATDNRHCGHFKGGRYDRHRFLPPDNPVTSALLRYLETGKVVPRSDASVQDQAKAQYLIDLLNLNCPRLVGRRRDHARSMRKTLGDPTAAQWIAGFYLQPQDDGRLRQFHSLSRTILLQ